VPPKCQNWTPDPLAFAYAALGKEAAAAAKKPAKKE